MSVDISLLGMKIIEIEGQSVPVVCEDRCGDLSFNSVYDDLQYIAESRPDLLHVDDRADADGVQFFVRNRLGLARYLRENEAVWKSNNILKATSELEAGVAPFYWLRCTW